MSDKIKYYKELAELENRITEIKKQRDVFMLEIKFIIVHLLFLKMLTSKNKL